MWMAPVNALTKRLKGSKSVRGVEWAGNPLHICLNIAASNNTKPRMKPDGSSDDDYRGGPQPPPGDTKRGGPDEDARFVCATCNRRFATAVGRGVHVKRAHPDVANEAVNVERDKLRWTEEESRLFAAAEAEAILSGGVKFMNQHLMDKFPRRTLESIKGKRRNPAYRAMVQEERIRIEARLREQRMAETLGPPGADVPESRTDHMRAAISARLRELLARLSDRLGHQGGRLRQLVEAALEGRDVSLGLSSWLEDVFRPQKQRSTRPRHYRHKPTQGSRRERRRAMYARVQRLYERNFALAARIVLDGDTLTDRPMSPSAVERYWRPLIEAPSVPARERDNLSASAVKPNEAFETLWSPVSIAEVASIKVRTSSAQGLDDIPAAVWNKVPLLLRALLYNTFLLTGKLEQSLLSSRTVFVPKKNGASTPSDFRPISIGSVVLRQFHAILAERLSKIPVHDERQAAFRSGDGIARNLYVLQALLTDARSKCRTVHLASVDVSKAFDTVSHESLILTLRGLGLPEAFVEYVSMVYAGTTTRLERDGWRSDPISLGRGVKQGDPLSPLLFNLVIGRALKSVREDVGYNLEGTNVGALAFADDVILIASSDVGLQTSLDTFTTELSAFGLEVNIAKSSTVSLMASGREKKVKHMPDKYFTVSGSRLQTRKLLDLWSYLGVQFEGSRVKSGDANLRDDLRRLSKAPLKPHQRLKILTTVLLPRHYHVWSLGRLTLGYLKKLDKQVREAVRSWLRLPKDVPIGKFHAGVKEGGLGVPLLALAIPMLKYARLRALETAEAPHFQAAARTWLVATNRVWCERALRVPEGYVSNSKELSRILARRLHESVDGKCMREAARCPASTAWVANHAKHISGEDYVSFHHICANTLPTRVRMTRGRRDAADISCRAGCQSTETAAHVVQSCFRTHGGRILRHDRVNELLAAQLKQKGWSVVREKLYRTRAGGRRPDMIATVAGRVVVIDAQVVSDEVPLDQAHHRKVDKYRLDHDLRTAIAASHHIAEESISFTSVTLSWRGVWSRQSVRELLGLGITQRLLGTIAESVLRGSYLNWVRFNQMTSRRGFT